MADKNPNGSHVAKDLPIIPRYDCCRGAKRHHLSKGQVSKKKQIHRTVTSEVNVAVPIRLPLTITSIWKYGVVFNEGEPDVI
jgi:hypothetical protein